MLLDIFFWKYRIVCFWLNLTNKSINWVLLQPFTLKKSILGLIREAKSKWFTTDAIKLSCGDHQGSALDFDLFNVLFIYPLTW